MWYPISNAPFDRDLELGVAHSNGVRAVPFPRRRVLAAGSRPKPRRALTSVRRIGAIGKPTGASARHETSRATEESKLWQVMSALPPKADMCGATSDVRFGPIADIAKQKDRLAAVSPNSAQIL